VRGLLGLLDSGHPGPMNLGGQVELTILQIAEAVLEVTGGSSKLVFQPLPKDDPTRRRPDISLARATLGWEPTTSLSDGLHALAEDYRTRRVTERRA
jgi:nucleoside-diphosphate-sugar epimerase